MGLFSRGSLFHRRSSLFGRSSYDDGPTTLGRGGGFWLTAPSIGLFVVSLVLAAAALLVRYASVDVPIVTSANAFAVLAIGYLILLVGVLLPRA
jgi:hypothetical protein